ncbi:MAG TPA: flagellin [Candidatus Sumerlaeota bacterium]|nr:flagellin [Candidatus Sumerlaeota bacterium]
MALSVNTNVASLNAQRNLMINSAGLGKSLQRLSSGLRINQASDDAAGLAISNGLTAQVRGLNQAVRNAGDGLSLLGTAESAISEQTNILQRIRELAVQAANDTNSTTNRSSLNDEVDALVSELSRIAGTVEFNGTKLLDGTFTAKELQVGASAGTNQKISIDISGTRATDIGSPYEIAGTAVTTGGFTEGQVKITVNGQSFFAAATANDGVSSTDQGGSALAYATAINAVSGSTGVKASASTSVTGAAQQVANHDTVDATNFLKINGVDVGTFNVTAADSTAVIDAINAKFSETGVKASLGDDDKITLTAEDGRNIEVAAGGDAATASGLSSGTTRGTVTLSSTQEFTVADSSGNLNADGTAAKNTGKNVNTIDISTKSGAEQAIEIVDVALENLNSRRAGIGALVSRLNSVISNLSAISENVAASNSRILDADFAAETANLTRTQILQQASVAVLAQANQAPQLALSLLR